MKTWYSIKAQNENEALIDIFDLIGYWGISARDFISDLKGLGGNVQNIRVRINSDGGEVFDGIAIYNALKRHQANVTVEVYGIAASIASIIAMAGDKVIMPANTFMFIHDPLAVVIGDADDMRDVADSLEKIAGALQSTYMVKTGKSEEDVKKWMNSDTWFTAQEALDAGLADEVTDAVKMAASANIGKFKNLPEALKALAEETPVTDPPPEVPAEEAAPEATAPPSEPEKTEEEISAAATQAANKRAQEILDACTKAGVPEAASEFLNRGLSADEVKAKLADANKIRARCAAAKVPERANGYIKAGMSVKEVADDLFDVLIARQGPEIDGRLSPQGFLGATHKPGGQAQNGFDPAAINKAYQDKEKNFGRKS